jgi:uncharacterized protein (TIGR03435 family)
MWLRCALALIVAVLAQSFDVVSIKPTPPGKPSIAIGTKPGRFMANGTTVSFLLQYAYGLQAFEIAEPGQPGQNRTDSKSKASSTEKMRRAARYRCCAKCWLIDSN